MPTADVASAAVTVNAAVLCQEVLEEKDGTLTAVRIIDRITLDLARLDGPPPAEAPTVPINTVFLLMFKKHVADEMNFTLDVTVTGPSGKVTEIGSLPVSMPSGMGKGQNLIVRLGLGAKDSGLYVFRGAIEGTVVAKASLEILISVTASATDAAT